MVTKHDPIDRRLGRIGVAILFVTLVTLPFNGMIAIKRLLLLAFVMAIGTRLWRRREWPRIPLLIACWFSLAPLSLLWSVNFDYTISQLLPDVLYPLLGLMAAFMLAQHEDIKSASIAGLVSGGIVVISTGLFQSGGQLGYDWYRLAHGYGQFSTYLILLLPFALVAAIENLRQKKTYFVLFFLLVLGAIFIAGYLANNRMFWLSSLLELSAITAIMVWRNEYIRARRTLILGAASVAMCIIAAFTYIARLRSSNVLGNIQDRALTSTFTNSERFEMWRFWAERIQDHPWFGVGFGYDLPMLTYRSLRPEHWSPEMFAHAHNIFIDVTLQLGAIGAAVFCILLFWLTHTFWKAARHERLEHALIGISGLGILVGMLSKNLTDDFFWRGPLFAFWLLIGLLLGQLQRENRTS